MSDSEINRSATELEDRGNRAEARGQHGQARDYRAQARALRERAEELKPYRAHEATRMAAQLAHAEKFGVAREHLASVDDLKVGTEQKRAHVSQLAAMAAKSGRPELAGVYVDEGTGQLGGVEFDPNTGEVTTSNLGENIHKFSGDQLAKVHRDSVNQVIAGLTAGVADPGRRDVVHQQIADILTAEDATPQMRNAALALLAPGGGLSAADRAAINARVAETRRNRGG